MCLCRNSCLPKGLANWTLIYNLPLEAKLEGDSSCLQLIAAQEPKPLLPWSCPQSGSSDNSLQPCRVVFSGICCHSQEIEYCMGKETAIILYLCWWSVFTWLGVKWYTEGGDALELVAQGGGCPIPWHKLKLHPDSTWLDPNIAVCLAFKTQLCCLQSSIVQFPMMLCVKFPHLFKWGLVVPVL